MNAIQKIRIFIIKHYKGLLRVGFSSALIALIIYEGGKQIQSIHLADTLHTMRAIPVQWLFLFFLLGIVASCSMILYDVFGMKAFKYEIDKRDLFSISFISNSLNTLLGFGGLSGASIRTLLLKQRNIESKETISYNAILMSAAIPGLSVFSIMALFNFKNISPILSQHKWLLLCLIGFSLYFIFYFFIDKTLKQFKAWASVFGLSKLFKLRIQLLGVSILEWLLAGVLFFALTAYFHPDQHFINIMSVFVIASAAGVLSFLPGGIGSFDLIAAIGLQIMGLSPNEALAVVILYRIFYYLFPSGTAIVVFSLQVLKKSEQKGYVIKSNVYGQLVATIMTLVVVACGLLLLVSALTPSLLSRSKLITDMSAIVFLHFSRSVSIAIGLMLLVTAKEIFLRVTRAYYITMILLLAGGIFTFLKGFDFEEFLFIIISMGVMRLSKTNFYRKSILIKPSHLIAAAISAPILLAVYLKISHILFLTYIRKFHYPHIIFHDISTYINAGVIAYTFFLIFIILWYLKRDRIEKDPRFQKINKEKLDLFFDKHRGHHLSHLIYLGDKNLFWAADGSVLIAYATYSDKVIALGDPMGEEARLSEGIQEFQRFIDEYGYRAVFYEVDEAHFPLYHDNGYYFFKLGEEAVVNLENFDMLGSGRRSFRNTVNRFEKDGYCFEVASPPFGDALLDELEKVSDEWLGKRKEMGFSIGWFHRDYLQNAPVAIVRNRSSNEIIAFVSVMFQGQDKEHVGIDLMRVKSEVPNSTMEFIFIRMLIYFKENGYKYFSFGVAPLAKVGAAPNSHNAEKIAHFIYEHGKRIYSFEGLRKFKDKFDPDWEPKYLAYPQFISLPALLMEISILVNKAKEKNK